MMKEKSNMKITKNLNLSFEAPQYYTWGMFKKMPVSYLAHNLCHLIVWLFHVILGSSMCEYKIYAIRFIGINFRYQRLYYTGDLYKHCTSMKDLQTLNDLI